jgi:hypothetical protein
VDGHAHAYGEFVEVIGEFLPWPAGILTQLLLRPVVANAFVGVHHVL